MIRIIGISMCILLFLASCDENRLYETNHELPSREWLADSVQQFEFTISDTTTAYNVYYNIRNTVSYPFRNIYIRYNLTDSSGNSITSALENGELFDARTGEPYGNGLGDVFDHQFPLVSNHTFTKSGLYRFEISQYMRRDTLPEIVAVGLRVEKATED